MSFLSPRLSLCNGLVPEIKASVIDWLNISVAAAAPEQSTTDTDEHKDTDEEKEKENDNEKENEQEKEKDKQVDDGEARKSAFIQAYGDGLATGYVGKNVVAETCTRTIISMFSV